MKNTYLKILLTLYNIKATDIAKIINCDRTTIARIIEGEAQLLSLETISKLRDILNMSLDLILFNNKENAIKITCESYSNPIYIHFYEYLILRLHDIIIDEYIENKEIKHILPTSYSYIFENTFNHKESIKNAIEGKVMAKNINMMLIPTQNKTYYNAKISTFFGGLFHSFLFYVYGKNYIKEYWNEERCNITGRGKINRSRGEELPKKELSLTLDSSTIKFENLSHTVKNKYEDKRTYLCFLDNFKNKDFIGYKVCTQRNDKEEIKIEIKENETILHFYDINTFMFFKDGAHEFFIITGKDFYSMIKKIK